MPHGMPAVVVPVKPWWRSRTVWFNAVVAALAVAEAHVQLLKPLLPADRYGLLVFVLVVGNTVLRAVTRSQLALGRRPPGGAR